MTGTGAPAAGTARRTAAGTARRTAQVVAGALVAVLAATVGYGAFRYRLVSVATPSMSPVIAPGDRFLVDTRDLTAGLGDVVVLDAPGWTPEGGTTYVVKRVVATAGQTVVCCDDGGRVSVDGTPLPGPVGAPPVLRDDGTRVAGGAPFEVTVPAGRVFVMGDNRPVSEDSRAHADDADGGTLPVAAVVGHPVFRLWPLTSSGRMDTTPPG